MSIIITITGDLGSGKTTVCNLLSEKYNLYKMSMGDLQRELANKYKMSTYEFNVYTELHPEIDDEIDSNFKKLAKSTNNMIIDSRMAWHFLPNSYKVFLTVDIETAAKRIIEDKRCSEKYSSINEAIEMLKARKTSENKRFLTKYGVDCDNIQNFDLIINTTFSSPAAIADKIMEQYKLFSI